MLDVSCKRFIDNFVLGVALQPHEKQILIVHYPGLLQFKECGKVKRCGGFDGVPTAPNFVSVFLRLNVGIDYAGNVLCVLDDQLIVYFFQVCEYQVAQAFTP